MDYKKGDCLIVLTNKQGHTFKTGQEIIITKLIESLEGGDFYMARGTLWDKTDYDQPIMAEETFDYALLLDHDNNLIRENKQRNKA